MGLFSGGVAGADEVRARADRARAKAVKAGIDVRGALGVGHMANGGASVYLLVFPDRLELVSTGQMGFRTGAGRSVIPLTSISRVRSKNQLLRGALLIDVDGATVEFTTDKAVAPLLRELIASRLAAGPVVNPLLKNLDELHAAGLLTDEEYAAKRAGLL
ncbi:hypothetical protein ACTI_53970 [Actinoplanes sp. OR16]|uniref:SHOCT domain-containing protein n=1 Tax=Actinoplanes sp. OR16 TaxID=946334 RepID=UPI000F6FD7AB|nr:SHOCT domain-containing protein [Actinoplanes sp. OR16]BBH68712.1 hypothetical protein ACTI_53970 [Actinoplanes sp. OR16]